MATVMESPTNEASSQSGTTIMGAIEMIEERLAAQAKVQQRLLDFAQELKASIGLAHERISGVSEGLVEVEERSLATLHRRIPLRIEQAFAIRPDRNVPIRRD